MGSARQIPFLGFCNIDGLSDHLEFQARSRTDQFDGTLRIFEAWQLNQNAIPGLTLQGGLTESEFINTIAYRFKRLPYCIVRNSIDLLLTEPIVLFYVATSRRQGLTIDVAIVFGDQTIDLLTRLVIVDDNNQSITLATLNPLEDNILLTQQSIGLVNHGIDPTLNGLVNVNTEDQMHPPLQVKTTMNRIDRFLPPAGQTVLHNSRRQ